MTTTEISEEKKKLATAILEAIWASPLYKDDKIDIEVCCIKPFSNNSEDERNVRDKITGVHVTAKVV